MHKQNEWDGESTGLVDLNRGVGMTVRQQLFNIVVGTPNHHQTVRGHLTRCLTTFERRCSMHHAAKVGEKESKGPFLSSQEPRWPAVMAHSTLTNFHSASPSSGSC
jgi:hypothetical protein